jgi:Ethanolamine utilization protein EutJ (predicted chaperonin)
VSTPSAAAVSGFTLGLDLGDCSHQVCVLDATGQMVREASLPNTQPTEGDFFWDCFASLRLGG